MSNYKPDEDINTDIEDSPTQPVVDVNGDPAILEDEVSLYQRGISETLHNLWSGLIDNS